MSRLRFNINKLLMKLLFWLFFQFFFNFFRKIQRFNGVLRVRAEVLHHSTF